MKFSVPNVSLPKVNVPNFSGAMSRVKTEVRSQLSSIQPEIEKFPSLAAETRAQLETESATRKQEFTVLGQETLAGTAGGGE